MAQEDVELLSKDFAKYQCKLVNADLKVSSIASLGYYLPPIVSIASIIKLT
jgi:hypothetical protein